MAQKIIDDASDDSAVLLAVLGNVPAAIATEEKALALDPLSAEICMRLAFFLVSNQQLAQARPLYEKALAIAPNSIRARYHLAAARHPTSAAPVPDALCTPTSQHLTQYMCCGRVMCAGLKYTSAPDANTTISPMRLHPFKCVGVTSLTKPAERRVITSRRAGERSSVRSRAVIDSEPTQ